MADSWQSLVLVFDTHSPPDVLQGGVLPKLAVEEPLLRPSMGFKGESDRFSLAVALSPSLFFRSSPLPFLGFPWLSGGFYPVKPTPDLPSLAMTAWRGF